MAFQDENVNRRQKEEIVHAKRVVLNDKKKQNANKTFVSEAVPPYKTAAAEVKREMQSTITRRQGYRRL